MMPAWCMSTCQHTSGLSCFASFLERTSMPQWSNQHRDYRTNTATVCVYHLFFLLLFSLYLDCHETLTCHPVTCKPL